MKLILVHIDNMSRADQIASYLPSNYRIVATCETAVLVAGKDDHGWTAEGYVIPRLASGLIRAEEIGREDPDSAAPLLTWLEVKGYLNLVHNDVAYDLTPVSPRSPICPTCGTDHTDSRDRAECEKIWRAAKAKDSHMTIPPLRVEVQADSSGTWAGNKVEYDDIDSAVAAAKDLMGRWTLVTDWRVVDAEDQVIRSRSDA